ncbi:hypothetical protein SKAU_G00003130 [Synaphobranchus kaupii]|uniref:Taste receptor type 2 n=1 Tax=Synaphobranchus kaupii TaxID=118154 RepID=A0A9Q1G8M0_SYNKA|nr:hypothetical protein SKAU_G00003130 [Synaphobranchus kaupii]
MVITVLWNICNLAVTVLHQWNTRGPYQPVGLIISCISISNVFLELSTSTILLLFWARILFSVRGLPIVRFTVFIWLTSCCISFWSIAWLSTFYCMKIISASNALLCKLKKNISPFINAALLLTVLCSVVACFPFLFLEASLSNSTIANGTRNATILKLVLPAGINTNLYIYVLLGFLCPVPVLVMLPTSLSLVAHLCRHALAMKKNDNEFQATDSYLMVCRMTVSMVGVYLTVVTVIFLFLGRCMGRNVCLPSFPQICDCDLETVQLRELLAHRLADCPSLVLSLPIPLRLVGHPCPHMLAMGRTEIQLQGAHPYLLVCKLTVALVGVYLVSLAIVSLFFFINQMYTKKHRVG